ncbi:MAG: ATP-grasp domain-containing protein [Deltaproteobacteria bacterium]|nr:ATP-grasp domain-containing protein [Deltaproteobacteria bacterium]
MIRNLFVVGLDDFHLRQLHSLARASDYRFISLISYEKIKCGKYFPVREFLQQAPRKLANFDGTVDAIIGFWDFPVSTLLPILQKQHGLRGPSLNGVLMCEHKYWSRQKQMEVVPELIPPFQGIDPYANNTVKMCKLAYPFWLKPVKSVLSYLGFLIRNESEFETALSVIKKCISRYAEPFNFILDQADLPEAMKKIDGYHCIAEGLISTGYQCTLEGYVHNGDVQVYGVVDSIREGEHQTSFSRYQYPSTLPDDVQQRMIEATARVITHLGYDNWPFNIEFYWNNFNDTIHLLEINTRISKSHCPLFKMVDGEYHHDVMIDIALGNKPEFPYRQGRYSTAAKFMLRCHQDGRVVAVPSKEEIARLKERFEGTEVVINVNAGTRLSELRDQDSYSYEIADVFLGADSSNELVKRYREAMSILTFHIVHDEEAK